MHVYNCSDIYTSSDKSVGVYDMQQYISISAETADLCTEALVIAEMFDHIVHQVYKALIECIVFTLHVCIPSNMHQQHLHDSCTSVPPQIQYSTHARHLTMPI